MLEKNEGHRVSNKNEYEEIKVDIDVTGLMGIVKIVSNQFQLNLKLSESLMEAKAKLMRF